MRVAEAYKDKDSEGKKEWSPLELAEMKTGRRVGQIRRAKGFSGRKRMRMTDQAACYHVMSRTVNGEFLLGKIEKEALRRMMWRMAKFAGVEILTYAIMDNHFHILLKVPEQKKWLKRFEGEKGEKGEEALFSHLSLVYSKAFTAQLRHEINELRARDEEEQVEALLDRFKQRFCDLSLFVKELKERFSRWYNRQHGRRGTLWMDRFKSVLVEDGQALLAMAAYIDLNPVRAGIVEDPAMYAWSGYGEAVGGSKRARRGLCKVLALAQDSWSTEAHRYYRKWLYAEGVVVEDSDAQKPSKPGRKGFSEKQLEEVVEEAVSSHLSLPMLQVRKRIRSFSEGIALGSEDFVKGVAARYQDQFERQKARKARRMSAGSSDDETYRKSSGAALYVMRN